MASGSPSPTFLLGGLDVKLHFSAVLNLTSQKNLMTLKNIPVSSSVTHHPVAPYISHVTCKYDKTVFETPEIVLGVSVIFFVIFVMFLFETNCQFKISICTV